MWERHDLVFFNRSSVDSIMRSARCIQVDSPKKYWDELFENIGNRIPGIVRRQEKLNQGYLDVGFTLPRRVNQVHYRVSASIPLRDIEEIITPFKVMEIAVNNNATSNRDVLAALHILACKNDLSVGLFGSNALQVMTGIQYTDNLSDNDLIISGNLKNLNNYYHIVSCIENTYGIVNDIEIRLPVSMKNGCIKNYDIKLKELMDPNKLVMGKGIEDIMFFRYINSKLVQF